MSLTGQCPRRAGMAGTSANFTSRAGPAIGSSCHLRRVQVPCRFDGPYDALARRDRVVALYSAAYFDRSRYTTNEWVVALLFTDENRDRLIPVRVADVPPELIPPLLKPILYRDIFGMGPDAAREALLQAVAASCAVGSDPGYPGLSSAPPGLRLPGACRRSGNFRPETVGLPAETTSWSRYGRGCWPGTWRSCRHCMAWAAWARPSSRSSTRTASPTPTT